MEISSQLFSSLGAAALIGVIAAACHADETCNAPYMTGLNKGQEDYINVWTIGVPGLGDGSNDRHSSRISGMPLGRWAFSTSLVMALNRRCSTA
jgi:hypothetical protein